jgi:acyl dehydratase
MAPALEPMLLRTQLEYDRRPSTAAFMLRAFYPPALRRKGRFPAISASWKGHRVVRPQLEELLRVTSLEGAAGLPLLYPHVLGFPLQMVILTHPAFPLPIWRVLQIRNHLLQHRPIPADAVLDLQTRVAGQRVLEKGVEVDLHTAVMFEERLAWESLNTFYYRGRFGEAGPPSPMTAAPEVGEDVVARWSTPSGGGWRFGALTGDYNGIHWSSRYARVLGFRRAFHHPQLVLGQALARLPAFRLAGVQRLDTWLKGPVYHGSDVTLRASAGPGGMAFAVVAEGERRPAIVGRWCSVASGSSLSSDLVGS